MIELTNNFLRPPRPAANRGADDSAVLLYLLKFKNQLTARPGCWDGMLEAKSAQVVKYDFLGIMNATTITHRLKLCICFVLSD
jgi:hypothetical protein